MLIGSKNLEIYSNVVPTVHNFVLLPPNERNLSNDNTSPICSPNGVWAAQAAFAPWVANARFFVSSDAWDVWQCELPVSRTNHDKFGTNSQSSRRQQNVLLVRSKRATFKKRNQLNFMSFGGPVNVRRRAPNGSAEFPKMRVQGL